MLRGTTTLECEAKIDGLPTDILVTIQVNSAYNWAITQIEDLNDGTQYILTSDQMSSLTNEINERWDEVEDDLEGQYADAAYESWRDEREMEF